MNQEENKVGVNPNNVISTNGNNSNDKMLAGSPGIVIAPVTEGARNASAPASMVSSSGVLSAPQTPTTTVPTSQVPVASTPASPRVEMAPTSSVPPVPPVEEKASTTESVPVKKPKKRRGFMLFLILLVLGMGVYIYLDYQKDMARGECSPLVASDSSERELSLDSSIVTELYDKVKTSVREDLAYHTFDDTLKLYLAYRQVPHSEIYDSNCNLFNENSMSNFTCSNATNFIPTAFSEDSLQEEVKKLFGESTEIENQNIVLGNSCFGGYQYIADRGEYVQGYCGQVPTTTYNADKELISASVAGDTITLREKVRYYSAQTSVPDSLQSGVYVYTFKLDNHYHYAYVSRSVEE